MAGCPSEHGEEMRKVSGFPRRLVPCFSPRPGPAGSAGDRARAEGATGRLSQGHAMTQSSWWKTTALLCHGVNGPASSPPCPSHGPLRPGMLVGLIRRGIDLAVLFQDISGNLNYKPSPQALLASKSPLSPRWVSP